MKLCILQRLKERREEKTKKSAGNKANETTFAGSVATRDRGSGGKRPSARGTGEERVIGEVSVMGEECTMGDGAGEECTTGLSSNKRLYSPCMGEVLFYTQGGEGEGDLHGSQFLFQGFHLLVGVSRRFGDNTDQTRL